MEYSHTRAYGNMLLYLSTQQGTLQNLSGMKHVMKGTRSLTRVDVSTAFASSAGPEHRSVMQHQLRSLNDNEDACLPSRVSRQEVWRSGQWPSDVCTVMHEQLQDSSEPRGRLYPAISCCSIFWEVSPALEHLRSYI